MSRLLIYILIFLLGHHLLAQEPPSPEVDLDRLAEQLFSLQEEALPYEDLYENLLLFYTQPLDINKANRESLQLLQLLSPLQIERLLAHRERNGPLLSLYELQVIPGWDLQSIQQVLPFVQVQDRGLLGDSRTLLDKIRNSGTRFALFRWEQIPEKKAGFTPRADSLPPAYNGSPHKLYFRLRMSKARSFSIGLTAEKDAGETLGFDPGRRKWGADFYSFHAMGWDVGPFKRVVVGDYQVQYGQGLVLGAGFYLGKGSETITTVARPSIGIRPYTSVLESGFFRGAAASLGRKNTEITIFASHAPRDASLRSNTDTLVSNEALLFSALQATGFHRTDSEIANRHTLSETNLGSAGRWRTSSGRLAVGFTTLYTRFSRVQQPLPRTYNQFAFSGRHNLSGSLFAEGHWQQISYFTEMAFSKQGGWGTLGGLIAPLSHSLDVSLLYRHYTPHFHSFYGAAFAEGSRIQNETGLYWGLKYSPHKELWFTAYFDRFWFPWLRYRVSAPSDGYEYFIRGNWQPNKQLFFFAQYRGEHKARDINGPDKTRLPATAFKQNYLLNLAYTPDKNWQLRSRVQWSSFQQNGRFTSGYALIQDASYSWRNWRLSTRYALFDTDDWDNRQYSFERDVLWAFSVPAYDGRGIRYYALLQCKARHNLSFWLRWARTRFRDREVIGSGHERITGNTRSNVKFQIKLDF